MTESLIGKTALLPVPHGGFEYLCTVEREDTLHSLVYVNYYVLGNINHRWIPRERFISYYTEQRKPKPHVITAYRHYTDPTDGPEGLGGWNVWYEIWDGEPGESGELDHGCFAKKKDAMEWFKKNYPGVKVHYSTEATRKQAA